ncbi:MAG: HD domain-containing protein [Betaproteobacteria bacterium]|nr:HD domain-containing protein [Betaproteobacteria bacterium]
MQMPEMNGAQLLQQVRAQWPETMRIMLTGTADLANAVAAINQGEIYRYVSKPWSDDELLGIVKSAVAFAKLAKERERLTALTQEQNKALENMVETLEEKVQARTASLRQAYTSSIKAFSVLLGLRNVRLLEHAKRVANTAMKMSQLAGHDHAMSQDIFIAGLLHDLGKIGLSDRVLNTFIDNLPQSDFALLENHCALGATCLKGLEGMDTVAQMIRAHHENFDGSGYPDRLVGEAIPIGGRFLAVIEVYEELMSGDYDGKPCNHATAMRTILSNRGKLFCPQSVDLLAKVMGGVPAPAQAAANPAAAPAPKAPATAVQGKDVSANLSFRHLVETIRKFSHARIDDLRTQPNGLLWVRIESAHGQGNPDLVIWLKGHGFVWSAEQGAWRHPG